MSIASLQLSSHATWRSVCCCSFRIYLGSQWVVRTRSMRSLRLFCSTASKNACDDALLLWMLLNIFIVLTREKRRILILELYSIFTQIEFQVGSDSTALVSRFNEINYIPISDYCLEIPAGNNTTKGQ